ncbi:Disulfide oxidoreductase YuzD [Evansella caseinilytica]|uniref:Disulfide oxidoreductase YuzD n=1 Tax=Evansella caseinilytica TaxID=1503961 RepID=A0A1H3UDL4_9BACI|nr:Disulfide oxidoreductase YuzD [Evansella caseinilytica]
MKPITFVVFGAEEKCASCIHLPGALETMEWLEAAVQRKFPDRTFEFRYCDIEKPQTDEEKQLSERILNDEFFYPLVLLNGEIVAEGNPKLSAIFEKIAAI